MMSHGMCMRVMMVLMDTDGDGTLSLEEFQTPPRIVPGAEPASELLS
jgi:hypothetical protein